MKLDSQDKIKQFLQSNPKASYIDNDGNYYSLENNELIIKAPNYYHSWNYVFDTQKELTQEYEGYPIRGELNELWDLLDNYYDGLIDRNNISKYSDTPLGALAELWEFGFYPPPEIMFSIARSYRHYETISGYASFEDVFFGKLKKGVGNYSAQKSKHEKMAFFHFNLTCNNNSTNPLPREEVAEKYIKDYLVNEEVDSFLRKYRRWLKSK
jgi:hypothetical protein